MPWGFCKNVGLIYNIQFSIVLFRCMKIDYLIIGQGIAGSVLSYKLLQAGCSVRVVAKQGLTISSEVAAGLYNPVTGRKMVKTWLADTLFPEIKPVYGQMEALTGARFLHELPIYRPFIDQAEQNDWFGRQADPAYSPYIAEVYDKPHFQPWVKNPYGGLLLRQSGWLDIPLMLKAWQSYLSAQGCLQEEEFDEKYLELQEEGVAYKGLSARALIYCNGNNLLKSPFWHWVPLRPVKGEVLFLKSAVSLEQIMNRGVFLLPLGEGLYKVGSTYDQRNLEPVPTEGARKDMLKRLSDLVDIPVEVKGQEAGIRPASKDRRPLVGRHPQYKTLMVFNGLGTKGVSLAPYCAGVLAEFLLSKKEISTDINIERFFSLYSL
jgi:glycine oxidase